MLPSEFRKLWEEFVNKDLSDCFIDFYDNPIEAFQLIQEFIFICREILDEQIQNILNGILDLINIERDKNINKNQIEKVLKLIFKENYPFIFESEKVSENFLANAKKKFEEYIKVNLKNFEKNEEFEDLINSRSFKNSLANLKKILFYVKFNEESLQFRIDSKKERKMEIRKFHKNECICVQGYLKVPKDCLILLSPPLMKNGYPYQNLKPVVIVYDAPVDETKTDETVNDINKLQQDKIEENPAKMDMKIIDKTNTIEDNQEKSSEKIKAKLTDNKDSEIEIYQDNFNIKQNLYDDKTKDNNKIQEKLHSYKSSQKQICENSDSPKNIFDKVLSMSCSQKYIINFKSSAEKLLSISNSDYEYINEISHDDNLNYQHIDPTRSFEKCEEIKSQSILTKTNKPSNKKLNFNLSQNDKQREYNYDSYREEEKTKTNNKEITISSERNLHNSKNSFSDSKNSFTNEDNSNPNKNLNINNSIKHSKINFSEIQSKSNDNSTTRQIENISVLVLHQDSSDNNNLSSANRKKDRKFIKTNFETNIKEKNNFFEGLDNKFQNERNNGNIQSSRSNIDFNKKEKPELNYLNDYDLSNLTNLRITTESENRFKNTKEIFSSDPINPGKNYSYTNTINQNVNNSISDFTNSIKFYNKRQELKISENQYDIVDSLESVVNLEKERGNEERDIDEKDINIFFSQSLNKNNNPSMRNINSNYNTLGNKTLQKSEKSFVNNSDRKKTKKGNMFIFQTDRTSENSLYNKEKNQSNSNNSNTNSSLKSYQKSSSKNKNVSSQYFRTGIKKITGSSLSKTPKFNKQRLDSPREYTTQSVLLNNNYSKSGAPIEKIPNENKNEKNLNYLNNHENVPAKNLNNQFNYLNSINFSSTNFQSRKNKNLQFGQKNSNNEINYEKNENDSENSLIKDFIGFNKNLENNYYNENEKFSPFDDNLNRGGVYSPKHRNHSSNKHNENLTRKKNSTNNFLISNIKTIQSSTLNRMQSINSYNNSINQQSNSNLQLIAKNRSKNSSQVKGSEDNNVNKRKLIQKESSVNRQPTSKSNDRKIFENRTNAQIKLNVEDLLSLKKIDKGKESPAVKDVSRLKSNKESLNIAKTHYLNIKYV